jgi:hypothetical protein
MKRNVAQSFFERGVRGPSNGAPSADAGSALVVGDAQPETRTTSPVPADAGVQNAPRTLRGIAQTPVETLWSYGPDDVKWSRQQSMENPFRRPHF